MCQAIIKMDKGGSFYLKNLGKCSISVNNKEVGPGQSLSLIPSCLIEVGSLSSSNMNTIVSYQNFYCIMPALVVFLSIILYNILSCLATPRFGSYIGPLFNQVVMESDTFTCHKRKSNRLPMAASKLYLVLWNSCFWFWTLLRTIRVMGYWYVLYLFQGKHSHETSSQLIWFL